MDALVYTAMSGANAALEQQAVWANNLANSSTQGFKAELLAHRSVPLRGDNSGTRVYALEATSGHSALAGPVQKTGRALDVALKGQAWLAVQSLDGSEAYTRAGALDVSAQGVLVNAAGLPVLSISGAPLNIPAGSELNLAADGTLTARSGQQPAIPLGRLKLVSESLQQRLTRGTDGLFRAGDGQSLDSDPAARIEQGALEGSNVNPVEAMVAMIQTTRLFESQMRMLQSAENNDKSASQLLTVNN